MTPIWEVTFNVETDGKLEPHVVQVWAPVGSGDDWSCDVKMTAVITGTKRIFGVSPEQALELAKQLAKTVYAQTKKVSADGREFNFPD